MENFIEAYEVNNLNIFEPEIFNLFQINYEFFGRKLFINKKNKTTINKYFPINEVKKREYKNINLLYLAFFSDLLERKVDDEFNLGIENFDDSFLKNILYEIFFENNEAYMIISEKIYNKDGLPFNEIFNERSVNFIGLDDNIIYSDNKKKIFIIKMNKINDIIKYKDFLTGFLINTFKTVTFEFIENSCNDLNYIFKSLSFFEYLILFSKYFSSNNLVIYSRKTNKNIIQNLMTSIQSTSIKLNMYNDFKRDGLLGS
mgnify:CR=1 FL=1